MINTNRAVAWLSSTQEDTVKRMIMMCRCTADPANKKKDEIKTFFIRIITVFFYFHSTNTVDRCNKFTVFSGTTIFFPKFLNRFTGILFQLNLGSFAVLFCQILPAVNKLETRGYNLAVEWMKSVCRRFELWYSIVQWTRLLFNEMHIKYRKWTVASK